MKPADRHRVFPSLYLAIVLTLIAFVSAARSQPIYITPPDDHFAAPVAWTQYKIPTLNVSISMPKLPVVRDTTNRCWQTEGGEYTAYADQAVYQFAWHAKSEKPIPKDCSERGSFSKDPYLERVEGLRRAPAVAGPDIKIMGSPAKMIKFETDAAITTHWLLWDVDRWFEMTVTRRKDAGTDEDKFASSLSLADGNAAEIGSGSPSILGDLVSNGAISNNAHPPGAVDQGITIISKPRPGYSELARTKGTQGTVALRVMFLKNGGIGTVAVIKTLENGLTERAIAAAQRTSFLPARANGTTVTVTKQIEYSFSLY